MRKITDKEWDVVSDYIPYALEKKVKDINALDVKDDYFTAYISKKGCSTRLMFKGVRNSEEIIKDGRLLIEKGNGSGYYGRGIYLADDIRYAMGYGDQILVVEVADDFYEHVTRVKRYEGVSTEEMLKKTEGYSGFFASDFGEDQHENEYVVVNNDAMCIRYLMHMNIF